MGSHGWNRNRTITTPQAMAIANDERSTRDDRVRMNRKTYRCSLPDGMTEREFAQIIFDQENWLRRVAG